MIDIKRRWVSLEAKLLRSVLYSFIVAISVAGVAILIMIQNITFTNMVDGISVTSKIISDRSAAALIFNDKQWADDNLKSARNSQGIEYLCLYNAEGELFSSYAAKAARAECEPKTTPVASTRLDEAQDYIAISMPIIEASELIGHLYTRASKETFLHNQGIFLVILFIVFGVSLVVVYLLGGRLVNRSLVQLDALYRTSMLIATNPLSDQRVKKISDDEVGRVVDVFNTMLDNLASENLALRFSENRFRSLAENAPIGVFLKNSRGEYEYTNSRWNEITGLDQDNAESFLSFIDRRDRSNYETTVANAHDQSECAVAEYRFRSPNHEDRVLMEYISPVEDQHGEISFIGSLLDLTELKEAQLELEKLAFYDPLTHLPNRRFSRDHLDLAIVRARKENKKIAMYMADLDNFKKVNDSFGHDVGDRLLVDIAARLRRIMMDRDVVSRLGGDEFMMILDDIEDPTTLDYASSRILDAMSTTVESGNQVIQVSGSLGIAIYPTDGTTPEELMRYADMALYNAKEAGGNRVSYYSAELDNRIKEKIKLEQKLRSAVEKEALDVYLQPQYDAQTRKMVWAEALVRWRDEEEGFISPDRFIPLAEETGLIFDVEDFVINRVFELISTRRGELDILGLGGISINLSARQLYAAKFSEVIAGKLKYFGIDAASIQFELTESAVMDDLEAAVNVMESLRALGFQIAIDDFGTGYSSLTYLKRFPINSVKIDKSFIQDIPDDQNDVEIACAIIALAHSLGLEVVAEGVESEIQASFLASRDCEYLQGFYFDRPLPIADLLGRANVQKKRSLK